MIRSSFSMVRCLVQTPTIKESVSYLKSDSKNMEPWIERKGRIISKEPETKTYECTKESFLSAASETVPDCDEMISYGGKFLDARDFIGISEEVEE